MIPLAILAYLILPVHSLIGYDCAGSHLNATTISLLDAGECNLQIKTPNQTSAYIQLLQLTQYNYAEVIQCKVELRRTIYYCGMHSHISLVRGGQAEYIEDTYVERCKQMHQEGVLNLGFGMDSKITGLKPNKTGTYSITIAGTIKNDGECKGIQYSDPYGTWEDVVVQGSAKVSLRTAYVPVHLESGKIHLPSGTSCDLRDGFCIDPEHGFTFWKSHPTTSCDFHQYDVLYEGIASRIVDESQGPHPPVIYSLETQDITFALATTKKQQVCGYTLLRTEHPKLFILETRKGDTPKPKGDIPVDNLDIFAYVNSKFVYVEKHIRTQMTSLYYNIMQQRCQLESEVLRNTLSFATLLPDEFAYRLMKGPGYMAVVAGEAIHVVKCIPVDAKARRTKECYQELPVTVRNASLYLTPKSRILTKFGTQRECSTELPTYYRFDNIWVQFSPAPLESPTPPQQLQPMTKISWKYLTPGPLAESGIYSEQDIEKLRDHIMFPAEKPAVLNSMARGITGYSMGGHAPPLHHLLDEDALDKLAQSTAARLWGGFMTFGSATAGVLGIFLLIRVVKIVIDTAIHGYALHTVYGCSLHLLGALWSSLTHLLLHLAHPPPKKTKPDQGKEKEGEELQPIGRQPSDDGPATSAPSAPPSRTQTHENESTRPSRVYLELSRRIDELDQLPNIGVGSSILKRGEV